MKSSLEFSANEFSVNNTMAETFGIRYTFSAIQLLLGCMLLLVAIACLVAIEVGSAPWHVQWLSEQHNGLSDVVITALDNLLVEALILLCVACSSMIYNLSTLRSYQSARLHRNVDGFLNWSMEGVELTEHRADTMQLQDEAHLSDDDAVVSDVQLFQRDSVVTTMPVATTLTLQTALQERDHLRCENRRLREQLDQAQQDRERLISSHQSDFLLMNVANHPHRRLPLLTDPSSAVNRRRFDQVRHLHRNQK